jgi:hypothetical protein
MYSTMMEAAKAYEAAKKRQQKSLNAARVLAARNIC